MNRMDKEKNVFLKVTHIYPVSSSKRGNIYEIAKDNGYWA